MLKMGYIVIYGPGHQNNLKKIKHLNISWDPSGSAGL